MMGWGAQAADRAVSRRCGYMSVRDPEPSCLGVAGGQNARSGKIDRQMVIGVIVPFVRRDIELGPIVVLDDYEVGPGHARLPVRRAVIVIVGPVSFAFVLRVMVAFVRGRTGSLLRATLGQSASHPVVMVMRHDACAEHHRRRQQGTRYEKGLFQGSPEIFFTNLYFFFGFSKQGYSTKPVTAFVRRARKLWADR